jgi:hypothetical protein
MFVSLRRLLALISWFCPGFLELDPLYRFFDLLQGFFFRSVVSEFQNEHFQKFDETKGLLRVLYVCVETHIRIELLFLPNFFPSDGTPGPSGPTLKEAKSTALRSVLRLYNATWHSSSVVLCLKKSRKLLPRKRGWPKNTLDSVNEPYMVVSERPRRGDDLELTSHGHGHGHGILMLATTRKVFSKETTDSSYHFWN